ncbi:methyl-accepting chemotaxis protein [Aliiglaciecola sp. CAU 1673]|uniref:methyl-accepting chemotaxis protein n=1 Tax=Aliiglaciecola sp. CAU 1673 TaxID=3032595 RepID=UPI0023DB545B|nr:methyl-accepting chemotaxis protein [Aliiglaciecola sp. CAU 1673]MDF2179956.1 methyl-accepting chemotaxis protein [Aliiglaciecola sp. CAU 1673]
MLKFPLSIKQKIALSSAIIALTVAAIVGLTATWNAGKVIETRMLASELPAKVQQIRNAIDRDIGILKAVARQIATNPYVLEWSAKGSRENEEVLLALLKTIAKDHQLATASFADRQTANYWNQDGFLRTLNHQQDGWFYAFTGSNQAELLSIFMEPSGETKLFVNFQQVDGRGLAGLAKSMDDMVSMLNQYRIEQSGFVFITDGQGQVKLHPDKSLVEKTTLTSLFDESTQRQLLATGDVNTLRVDKDGEAFVLASSHIPAMGWYVVAQVPEHEVLAELNNAAWSILLWTLLVAALATVAGVILARTISKPLTAVADLFTQLGEGEGNLGYRMPEKGQPEISQMAGGFNRFIEKIQQTVIRVNQSSHALKEAADNTQKESAQSLKQMELQRQRVDEIAQAINDINNSIADVAANAAKAADLANESQKQSHHGSEITHATKTTMDNLDQDIQQVAEQIQRVASDTQSISSILDVINGISEQTNLLALNAAIESARAGEHGRGFAVVADEVRQLARRTAESTAQIQTMIGNLQDSTNSVVRSMENSRSQFSETAQRMGQVALALEQVDSCIEQMHEVNLSVAAASEEQAATTGTVSSNVSSIREVTEHSLEASRRLALASESLKKVSSDLDGLMRQFNLGTSGR